MRYSYQNMHKSFKGIETSTASVKATHYAREASWIVKEAQLIKEVDRLRREVSKLAKRDNQSKRQIAELVAKVKRQPPPAIPELTRPRGEQEEGDLDTKMTDAGDDEKRDKTSREDRKRQTAILPTPPPLKPGTETREHTPTKQLQQESSRATITQEANSTLGRLPRTHTPQVQQKVHETNCADTWERAIGFATMLRERPDFKARWVEKEGKKDWRKEFEKAEKGTKDFDRMVMWIAYYGTPKRQTTILRLPRRNKGDKEYISKVHEIGEIDFDFCMG